MCPKWEVIHFIFFFGVNFHTTFICKWYKLAKGRFYFA
jgi:hypothetical protein